MGAPPNMILVVEDDASLGDALRQCFLDEGYAPTLVTTLRDGRSALRASRFDFALLDLNLCSEGATSEPLLGEMCVDERAPLTVLMSAAASAVDVAHRYGVPLLAKPFDLDALFMAIGRGRRPTITLSPASEPELCRSTRGNGALSPRA